MLIAILSHTPLWVWALLLALAGLGLWQSRTREVPPARVLVLPLVLLALGLWSLLPVLATQPLTGLLWLTSLLLTAGWMLRRPPRAGAAWLPEQGRIRLPGSWMPLVTTLAVFSLRYTLAVSLVLHPGWRTEPLVQLPAALLFGGIAGLLLGRALGTMRFVRAARRAHETIDAHAAA